MGVTGTISAVVLSSKASYHLGQWVEMKNQLRHNAGKPDMTAKEILKDGWQDYIPAAIATTGAVACTIGANHVSSKRVAAVTTAYTLSEKAFSEYKDKVVEKLGAKKDKDVRREVAEDRVKKTPPGTNVVTVEGESVLCCDALTMRYFSSSMEKIRRAQNNINEQILNYRYATLADFYDELGLTPTSMSKDIGWNSDNMLRIDFSAILTEDKRPCIYLDYVTYPVRDYFRP